jgi:hypothetical protein
MSPVDHDQLGSPRRHHRRNRSDDVGANALTTNDDSYAPNYVYNGALHLVKRLIRTSALAWQWGQGSNP